MRYYDGVIKSYNHGNGYGFIDCAETREIYGQDVFLHKNEFMASHSEVGQSVKFQVVVSEKGQPRAVSVQGGFGGGKGVKGPHLAAKGAEKGLHAGGKGAFHAGAPIHAPGMAFKRPLIQAPQRNFGQIRTFNQEKGFGFIECAAALRTYGTQDVFLHYSEAINFRVGDMVSFDVVLSEQGKPQARGLVQENGVAPMIYAPPRVAPMFGGPAAGIFHPHMMGDKGNFKGKGKGKGKPPSPNKEYTGVIKSYNESKGYGFIACEETERLYGRDVFLNKEEVTKHAVAVGENLVFKVILNQKGMPQAEVVAKADALKGSGESKLEQCGEGPHVGIIKSFNEANAFGFIQCPAIEEVFGCDVFLHRKELAAGQEVGKEVQFNVTLNGRGQPQATQVTVLGEIAFNSPESLEEPLELEALDEPAPKRLRVG